MKYQSQVITILTITLFFFAGCTPPNTSADDAKKTVQKSTKEDTAPETAVKSDKLVVKEKPTPAEEKAAAKPIEEAKNEKSQPSDTKADKSGKVGKIAASKPKKGKSTTNAYQRKSCKGIESIYFEEKMPKPEGSFKLISAKQVDGCLEITIEHTGNTMTDMFHLVWNGAVMKSLPPIAQLRTIGRVRNEGGEVRQQQMYFDVSPLAAFGKQVNIQMVGQKVPIVNFDFEL